MNSRFPSTPNLVGQSVSLSQPAADSDPELTIGEILHSMLRFKWGILGLVISATILSWIIAISLPPKYTASSTLYLTSLEDDPLNPGKYQDWALVNERIHTEIEILKSKQIARRVVDMLGYSKSELVDPPPKAVLKRGLGIEIYNPFAAKPSGGEATPNQLASVVRSGLDVELVPLSHLIKISYTSYHPEVSAAVADATAKAYIRADLDSRATMRETASDWMSGQLTQLQSNMREAERKLQEFRDAQDVVDIGGIKSAIANEFSMLSANSIEAKRQRAKIENRYRESRKLKSAPLKNLESVPSVMADPVVQRLKSKEVNAQEKVNALKKRYGPKHPKMIDAATNLKSARTSLIRQIKRVVDTIEKDYQLAVSNQRSLTQQLSATEERVKSLNRNEHELNVLQREVDATRELYNVYLEQLKQGEVGKQIDTVAGRIIDHAEIPSSPSAPRVSLIVAATALFTFVLGSLIAYLIQMLDVTYNNLEEVEANLNIPGLSMMPKLSKRATTGNNIPEMFRANDHRGYSESVRTLRTAVSLSSVDTSHKVYSLTSAWPSEGKTFVSISLAAALASVDKTLLIGCDLRRPGIASFYPDIAGRAGLTDAIVENASIEDVIVQDPNEPNLFVLPAGTTPPNPLEILDSNRFEKLLTELKKEFRHIILDTPPINVVSDAQVLQRYATATMLVIRAHKTSKKDTARALIALEHANAPLYGVVLNQVEFKRSSYTGYYAGDYGY